MKRWITIAVAAAVIIGGGLWYWQSRNADGPQDTQVKTVTVERGDLRVAVAATGELEPLTTVEVKSKTGGEIATMNVEAGDYVKKGDIIAQIDPTDLESEVQQARASVNSAAAKVQQARINVSSQSEQTRTSVAEARASLASAQARLRQAEATLTQTEEKTEQNIAQAQARLRSARAQLEQARVQEKAEPKTLQANIAQAEASLENARQKLSALEAGNRPEEIAQAKASVAEREATLTNAQAELTRMQQLNAKGFVSDQELDNAQRAVQTAQAQFDSARQAYTLAQKGARTEEIEQARAQVRQAEASLEATRTQQVQVDVTVQQRASAEASVAEAEAALAVAEAGRRDIDVREGEVDSARQSVEQARATLEKAQAGSLAVAAQQQAVVSAQADQDRSQAQLDDVEYNFENTTVIAPRDGVVLEKHVEEGSILPAGTAAVASGTAIVTIADITEMYVMADVDEVDISRVQVGQDVEITVETIEDKTLAGRVDKIYPQGTSEDNVIYFPVRIVVSETHPDLRPGMTADVSIVTANKGDVLIVPDTAIDHTGDQETVLVVRKAGERPEKRVVETGVTDYEETEIISGLREGERLLLPDGASGAATAGASAEGDRQAGGPPPGAGAMMRR